MLRTEAVFALCGLAAALGPFLRAEPDAVEPLTCAFVVSVVEAEGTERLVCADDPALSDCDGLIEGRRYLGCEDVGAIRGPVLSMRGQPIDANEATAEDFRALPGVGEGLARRLVEGRSEEPYCEASDLARVSGVGKKRAAALAVALTFHHPLCAERVAK